MKITRTSALTGVERTMDIDVTEEQITAWQLGMLIQDVMPHLTPDEREFIMSGVTAEEWKEMMVDDFGHGEEQEDND